LSGGELRAARKELARLERELERHSTRERALETEMAANASDHARLTELSAELDAATAERERLESAWLEAAASVEDSS
jgi:predicted  nucleic acid-binding Zn-ribbon protein